MTDRIELVGIEVWAHHGVLPHETELGQRFLVDVAMEVDLAAAAASDDLADTVDYGGIAELVVRVVADGPRADLVEVVADRVATAVLIHDHRVGGVEVALHKPYAPLTVPAADVVVRVRRERPS